jgi:hypothetical protein
MNQKFILQIGVKKTLAFEKARGRIRLVDRTNPINRASATREPEMFDPVPPPGE